MKTMLAIVLLAAFATAEAQALRAPGSVTSADGKPVMASGVAVTHAGTGDVGDPKGISGPSPK